MSKRYGKGALVGTGLLGVVVGFATATVVLERPSPSPSASPAEVVAPPAIDMDDRYGEVVPPDDSDPLKPVLDVLARAHATAHGSSSGEGTRRLPRRLREAIASDPWHLELRQKIHEAHGGGQFVSHDGLTPLGKALLEHLVEMDRHGLDPTAYKVDALQLHNEGLVTPTCKIKVSKK